MMRIMIKLNKFIILLQINFILKLYNVFIEKSKTNTLQATNSERNQKETKKGTPEQAIREKRTANVKNMEEKCLSDSFHAF